MTRSDFIRYWASVWARDLRTWGRPLTEVNVVVKERRGRLGSGLARPVCREVIIRAGSDIPDGLATILHELAHVAAPGGDHHGERWRRLYTDAVCEVTGIPVCPEGTKTELERSCRDALASWWDASGHRFAYSLLVKEAR